MVREIDNTNENCALKREISINALTESVLDRYSNELESRRIRVETELQQLKANVIPKSIVSAVCVLLEHAISATPCGGELNITLIEVENCWELEIADSGTIGAPANLDVAHQAADVHGGKIQSLACPQGGNANILVIPQDQATKQQNEATGIAE